MIKLTGLFVFSQGNSFGTRINVDLSKSAQTIFDTADRLTTEFDGFYVKDINAKKLDGKEVLGVKLGRGTGQQVNPKTVKTVCDVLRHNGFLIEKEITDNNGNVGLFI